MFNGEAIGLSEFLYAYPRMVVRPDGSRWLNIEGDLDFIAISSEQGRIIDSFRLQIRFPEELTQTLPLAYEVGGRIPRQADYHVNLDGSLCLGSPLRILSSLATTPNLVGYAEKCLVPYLSAVSYKLQNGGPFIFGELLHGPAGELADYTDLFDLETPTQARLALRYLALKKRRANKLPCPCGCSLLLGQCRFNEKLREFRKLAPRAWFKKLDASMP